MRTLILIPLLFVMATCCHAQVVTTNPDSIPAARADSASAFRKYEKAKEAADKAKDRLIESKIHYRKTGDRTELIEAEGEYKIAMIRLDKAKQLVKLAKLDALPMRKILFGIDNELWSPTFKVEGRVHKYVTLGAQLRIKYIYTRGAKIEPFIRIYPSGRTPSGGFIQMKGSAGLYHTQILTPENIHFGEKISGRPFDYSIRLPYTRFFGYGAGVAGGYQKLIGPNKHGFFEVYGGIQVIKLTLDFPYGFVVQHAGVMCPLEIGIRLGGAF